MDKAIIVILASMILALTFIGYYGITSDLEGRGRKAHREFLLDCMDRNMEYTTCDLMFETTK